MADLVKLIARVPPELRDAVKVEAARSRRSMGSIVIKALESWLLLEKEEREAVAAMEARHARD